MTKQIMHWISAALLATAGGCGAMHPKEPPIRFSEEENVMSLRSVDQGGDFALFYAGHEKAEVPVRVQDGDTVGFFRVDDGRLKAVAGPFKMDMDPTVREAYWKRLPAPE